MGAAGFEAAPSTSGDAPVADEPVSVLAGAGPVTAARLAVRGLVTVSDLLRLLPRAYEDLRSIVPLSGLGDVAEGTFVVVKGRVVRLHLFPRRFLDVHIEDAGTRLRARWFRPAAGMARSFAKGTEVSLAGALRRGEDGALELIHPTNVSLRLAEAHATGTSAGFRIRYPPIEGVSSRVVEKVVSAAVDHAADESADCLPSSIRLRLGLPTLGDSLRSLHRPTPDITAAELEALRVGRSPHHRRLAIEELLVVLLAARSMREQARREPARGATADQQETERIVRAALPFALTGAQERAIAAVLADLAVPHPMRRLVQGEVGSGKTAVAFAAALSVARSRMQAALMAPTEVLAEQHSRTFQAWGAASGLRVALLTGSLSAHARRLVLADAADGRIDLLIGTHALLEASVRLPSLGLTIIDEQHRFGVRQRATFSDAGSSARDCSPGLNDGMLPHLLVLTATPIPRTLALTVCGHLDLTTINELPPGREPVTTHLALSSDERDAAYVAVARAVAGGRQAYVVCPAIGAGEGPIGRTTGPAAVVAHSSELRRRLHPARVGLVHGRLPSQAQQEVLRAFRDGALDVLVATTILEVGIDVPRASVMVVEDADRFGLAQLHQLRGRVGRAGGAASCWLCARDPAPDARQRLQVLVSSADGFRVAEEDLRQRGPGDLFGARQAGASAWWSSDPASFGELIELVRTEAEGVLSSDPVLERPEHAPLRQAVRARRAKGNLFAEEAG